MPIECKSACIKITKKPLNQSYILNKGHFKLQFEMTFIVLMLKQSVL
jgi:hypothetical protein